MLNSITRTALEYAQTPYAVDEARKYPWFSNDRQGNDVLTDRMILSCLCWSNHRGLWRPFNLTKTNLFCFFEGWRLKVSHVGFPCDLLVKLTTFQNNPRLLQAAISTRIVCYLLSTVHLLSTKHSALFTKHSVLSTWPRIYFVLQTEMAFNWMKTLILLKSSPHFSLKHLYAYTTFPCYMVYITRLSVNDLCPHERSTNGQICISMEDLLRVVCLTIRPLNKYLNGRLTIKFD